MKKYLLLTLLAAVSISGFAQKTEDAAENMTKVVYAQSGTIQQNGTGTIDIVMKNDEEVGTIACWFTLPEGVTVDETNSTVPAGTLVYNYDAGLHKCVIFMGNWAASGSEPQVIAKIKVNVPSTVDLGSYELKTQHWEVTTPEAVTEDGGDEDTKNPDCYIIASVKVQRAAVIEKMDGNNNFEIIPQALTAGTTDNALPFYLNNVKNASSVTATIELPTGFTITDDDGDPKTGDLNDDRLYYTAAKNAHSISIEQVTGKTQEYSFDISSKKSTSYITPSADNENAIGNLYLDVASTVAPGVYTIKLKNITVSAGDDYTGDYYFSVFVGTPTETDPILYGHYTTKAATTLGTIALAQKGNNEVWNSLATIDLSAAKLDVEESTVAQGFEGKLVYGPEKTSFYRAAATGYKYGTVCLPFDLTSSNGTFYTLSSATGSSLTFQPATGTIAANTPVLFEGTVNAAADGYQYAATAGTENAANGLTFTGTYAKQSITSGYYIANDAFWKAESTTVIPAFRGYFAGSVSSAKLSIFIDDATGIHEITNELSDEDIYNLSGMKLTQAKKGAVNIIGGKKVLVK